MKILGIDPGSKVTGYGLIEVRETKIHHIDCGGIHIPVKEPMEMRLLYIHRKIRELLTRFKPDLASVEDVFFAKNARTSLILGQVRGVILLALAEFGIPFSSYPPCEVKKAITGYGVATKDQVQYMVKCLLGLKEEAFEDASDALALAICHGQSIKLSHLQR